MPCVPRPDEMCANMHSRRLQEVTAHLQILMLWGQLVLCKLEEHVDEGGALLVVPAAEVAPQLAQLVLETLHPERVPSKHVP